jgi:hypothetical protein
LASSIFERAALRYSNTLIAGAPNRESQVTPKRRLRSIKFPVELREVQFNRC